MAPPSRGGLWWAGVLYKTVKLVPGCLWRGTDCLPREMMPSLYLTGVSTSITSSRCFVNTRPTFFLPPRRQARQEEPPNIFLNPPDYRIYRIKCLSCLSCPFVQISPLRLRASAGNKSNLFSKDAKLFFQLVDTSGDAISRIFALRLRAFPGNSILTENQCYSPSRKAGRTGIGQRMPNSACMRRGKPRPTRLSNLQGALNCNAE